jgi:hypothetical protein
MAITTNTINIATPPSDGTRWYISKYSADLSGCEELVAASTGESHYLEKLVIYAQSETDITVSVGSGETTGAVTTIHLGPIPLSDTGSHFEYDWSKENKAVKCTASASLTVDASAACPIWIYAEGVTG